LPGGGGNEICGLFDVKPTLFGQVNNLVTQGSNFGKQTEVFNGVDLTMRMRFGRGSFLQGGLSTGQTATNNCYAKDRPNVTPQGLPSNTPRTDAFCNVAPPYSANTQLKLNGSYTLPWDVQASAAFQNLPGVPVTASYVATNAQIVPSLHRNLSGSVTQVIVANVIPPGSAYENRFSQLDLRLSKIFQIGTTRLQASFDLFNLLNASPILTENGRYGPAWLTPTGILDARLAKFGAKFTF
jgi:hypothetical protein